MSASHFNTNSKISLQFVNYSKKYKERKRDIWREYDIIQPINNYYNSNIESDNESYVYSNNESNNESDNESLV